MSATALTGPTPVLGPYIVRSYRLGRLSVLVWNGWPWLSVRRERECPSITFAKAELARIRGDEPDEMQDAIEKHILKMIRAFSDEGHSGSSASYTIGILEKLLRFEPITPLTGADDEWNEVGDGYWQNRRCGRVFKGTDGRAYDIDGRVFMDPDGCAYTSRDSRVYVTFPYTPTIQYVRRPGRDERGRFRKASA